MRTAQVIACGGNLAVGIGVAAAGNYYGWSMLKSLGICVLVVPIIPVVVYYIEYRIERAAEQTN